MKTIISQNQNHFTLYQEFESQYKIDIKFTAEHYRNGENEYFDISYEYSSPDGIPNTVENPAHPFFQKPNVDDPSGVIVAYNEVTASLVKYLLLNDSELSKHTGTSTPMRYRRMMILTLDSLWD